MTAIQRQRVVWTGFPGGPGLSTFYFADAAAAQGALRTFLFNASGVLPPDVTLTIQPGGDVIDDTTGVLLGSWAGTLQTPVVGGAPIAAYSAPSGILLRWETLTVRAGSRLRGRTYFVPAAFNSYQADGSIDPSILASILGVAVAFVGAVTPNLLVWQRPRAAAAAYTGPDGKLHKAVSARLGSSAVVVQASIPDKAVVLRSRRD